MRFVLALALAVGTSVAAISHQTPLERSVSAAKPPRVSAPTVSGPEAFYAVDTAAVLAWIDGELARRYLDALEAERLERERAAAEAEARAAAVRRQDVPRPTTAGGDCAPVAAIIGWGIVNRESGGNPGAVNPSSGAFGCSQTLPSHYNPGGTCAGLDMYSVEGQTECTQRLYNAGGLRPWGG